MGRRSYKTTAPEGVNFELLVRRVKKRYIALAAVGLIFVVGGIILLVNNFSHSDNLEASYDDAKNIAVDFVNAMDDESTDNMFKYLPADISKSGIIADSMGISDIRSLEEKYDITLSNVVINSSETPAVDTAVLTEGIKSVYNIDMIIDDATIVPVSADISYVVNDKEYKSSLDFQVVCMYTDSKWYVYTGDYTNLSTSVAPVIITPDYTMGSIDMVPAENTETTADPVVKNRKELASYRNMTVDLSAGKFSIDDVNLIMPCVYSDIFKAFRIDRDLLDDTSNLLMPRSIYSDLPVKYINDDYSVNSFRMDIANAGEISQNITDKNSDFIVSSLYFCRMDNGEDYAQVYLPGNVTFDVTYDEVKALYGSSISDCVMNDNIIRHDKCISIYQIQLDNPNNYLYLQFDIDGKLVAMQYYCLDISR